MLNDSSQSKVSTYIDLIFNISMLLLVMVSIFGPLFNYYLEYEIEKSLEHIPVIDFDIEDIYYVRLNITIPHESRKSIKSAKLLVESKNQNPGFVVYEITEANQKSMQQELFLSTATLELGSLHPGEVKHFIVKFEKPMLFSELQITSTIFSEDKPVVRNSLKSTTTSVAWLFSNKVKSFFYILCIFLSLMVIGYNFMLRRSLKHLNIKNQDLKKAIELYESKY